VLGRLAAAGQIVGRVTTTYGYNGNRPTGAGVGTAVPGQHAHGRALSRCRPCGPGARRGRTV